MVFCWIEYELTKLDEFNVEDSKYDGLDVELDY